MSNNEERYLLQALEFEGMLRARLRLFADRESDVDTLLQITYARLLNAGSSPERQSSPIPALALTLSRQVGADWMRRMGAPPERIAAAADAAGATKVPANPGMVSDNRTRMEVLLHVVQDLSIPCRRVFTLRKVYGYSQKEIALRLDLSSDVVEQCLTRAVCDAADSLFTRRQPARASLIDRLRPLRRRTSEAAEISAVAAQWLIRIESPAGAGSWDPFQSWLDRNPCHRAAFVRLRTAWIHFDLLKHLRPHDRGIDPDLLAKARSRLAATSVLKGIPLTGPRARAARLAVVGLAILTVAMLTWLGYGHLAWVTYRTDVGEQLRVALPDGTSVYLNTDTELRARVRTARRDIMLQHGEALFRVAPDPERPFTVFAGSTVVRAVGTEFSIWLRAANRAEILLSSGTIAVATHGSAVVNDPLWAQTARRFTAVTAIESSSTRLWGQSISAEQLRRKLAWMDGHLAFQGEPLAEAVQEFNRYNRRHLTIADPNLLRLRVGGIFRTTDPDSFVAALRKTFGIRAVHSPAMPDLQLVGDPSATDAEAPP